MLTEVRICGRKLFYPHMWRVLIDGKKWWYLEKTEMFVDEHGMVTPRKDMPLPVQLGFIMAWENTWCLYEKYSRRRSYGWQVLIDNLNEEGRHIVVMSRGRRMGIVELVSEGTPLENVTVLSPPAVCDRHQKATEKMNE